MVRIGLMLVVLALAAGRAMAWNPVECGAVNQMCCESGPVCNLGLVCDSSNTNGCDALVLPGRGDGGAAGFSTVCPGTCVQPTQTPTATETPTPTPTMTPTPHNLPDNASCNDSRQCISALCNGGVCAEQNPAPAVSSYTAVFIGTVLLLAGLWSLRRVARRR
jgi:hypothetical protein